MTKYRPERGKSQCFTGTRSRPADIDSDEGEWSSVEDTLTDGPPDRNDCLREIAHYSRLARECDAGRGGEASEADGYYAEFVRRRLQLLRAIEAGHPENWRDYSGEPAMDAC